MKNLLKKLALTLALGVTTLSFAQNPVSLTFTSDATEVALDGSLPTPIVFTISDIPDGTTNAMNIRLYEASANIIGGLQSATLTGFSLDSNTADVTSGNITTTTTVTTTGFINRTYTVNAISTLAGGNPLVDATNYNAVIRIVHANNGAAPTFNGNNPFPNGASGSEDVTGLLGNKKHFFYVLNSLTGNASLSTEEINTTDISSSIYPNPTTSILNISDSIKTETYKVISILGQTIKEVQANGVLDVSDLSNGVYFLVTDSGISKFVKQ